MRISTPLFALSAPLLAQALPWGRRATVVTPGDLLVFKFAHVLEQLETQFYQQAIQKFTATDFLNAGFSSADVIVEQITSIAFDESTHTDALAAAIVGFGSQPITNCVFDFSSALTDVPTLMATARVVENVGVGAYLGAAQFLSDPRFITTAASILAIEARHSTILNAANGGTAIPQAFDIPLSPQQVAGIAGGFISGCDIGVTGNPPLTITNTGPVGAGTALGFSSPALTGVDPSTLFCNMIVGGARTAISLPFSQCIVPQGLDGPVVISILNDSNPLLASDIVDQSALTTVAGPVLAYLDFGTAEQTLSQLMLTPSSPLNKNLNGVASAASNASCTDPGCASSSNSTISPSSASAIASNATSTDGASLPAESDGSTPAATGDGIGLTPVDSSGNPINGTAGVTDSSASATDSAGDAAPTDSASATDSAGDAAPTDSTDSASATDSAGDAAPTDSSTNSTSTDPGAVPLDSATSTDSSGDAAPTDAGAVPLGGDNSTDTGAVALAASPSFKSSTPDNTADNGAIVVLGMDPSS